MTKEQQVALLKETIELISLDIDLLNDMGFVNLSVIRQHQLRRYKEKLNELIR